MFGKTDAVHGVFYVHTRFFHVNFMPLVPKQTYLCLTLRNGEQRAIGIPTSGSSVCAAWLRYLSVISVFLSLLVLFIVVTTTTEAGEAGEAAGIIVFLLGLFALACGFVYFAFRYSAKASYERAIELCSHLGQYEPHYRRIIDAEFSKIDGAPFQAEATVLPDDDEEETFQDEDETEVEITEFPQAISKDSSEDYSSEDEESTMMTV